MGVNSNATVCTQKPAAVQFDLWLFQCLCKYLPAA